MNNIIKYITAIIFLLSFLACYDDKGNYNYVELNEIIVDTVGFKTSYSLGQLDTLKINPIIKFSKTEISEENLSYEWKVNLDKFENTSTNSWVISNEKNLNVIINIDPSDENYALWFNITDETTGTVYQTKFTLRVNANILSGIVVLHSNGLDNDIDYIASVQAVPTIDEPIWMRNVFSNVNGRKIQGNPNFIYAARRSNTVINYIYIGTDEEFIQISAKDFTFQEDASGLFSIQPNVLNPQTLGFSSTTYVQYTFLINNGKLHNINNNIQRVWDQVFSAELGINEYTVGDYELEPYVYVPDQFSSYTNFGGVVYDKLNQRFLILPHSSNVMTELSAFLTPSPAPSNLFNVNDIGKHLLYLEKGYNSYGYSVFKDDDLENYYLYVADFNQSKYDDNWSTQDELQYAVSVSEMTDLPDIQNAKFYQTGNRGHVFFYATEKNIYTYDYNGSNTATQINESFPAGEEITCMLLYKPGNINSLNDANGRYLYVATWDGTEGRLYEFEINVTNGNLQNDKKPVNTYTGFGKITSISTKIQGTGSGS